MDHLSSEHRLYRVADDAAPVIYLIAPPGCGELLGDKGQGRSCHRIILSVRSWDDDLTPWTAPGLYRGDADFGGKADETLDEMIGRALPAIEAEHGISPRRRALAGYSLSGLFALYALTRSEAFEAVASMSGSLWYEHWVDYLRQASFEGKGRFAFVSLGSKEKQAMPVILHEVQARTETSVELLRSHGLEVEYRLVPGGHHDQVVERILSGLDGLEDFLVAGR